MSGHPNNQDNPASAIPFYQAGGTYFFHDSTFHDILKEGFGSLQFVNVTIPGSSSTVTLYDGTDNTGPVITRIASDAQVSFDFGVAFTTGLYAEIQGTTPPSVTIGYR